MQSASNPPTLLTQPHLLTEAQVEVLLPAILKQSRNHLLVVTNLADAPIYVNQIYRETYLAPGQTLAELDLGQCIHPADLAACKQAIAACLARGGQVQTADLRQNNRQGGYFWARWDFAPFYDLHGTVVGIISLGHDITEQVADSRQLRKSEMVLRALLDSTHDANMLISADFKILSLNRTAAAILAQIRNSEVQLGDDMRPFIVPGAEDLFYAEFAHTLVGHPHTVERPLQLGSTAATWFEFSYYPVATPAGHIMGVAINARNITTQKTNELAEKQRLAELARANEALRKISWIQSHRVRAPLASILGLVQLLKSETNADDYQFLLGLLVKAATELDTVIHDVVASANTSEDASEYPR